VIYGIPARCYISKPFRILEERVEPELPFSLLLP
jgi:hypothetical protein